MSATIDGDKTNLARHMSGPSTPLEKGHSSTRIGEATTTDGLPLITTANAFGVSRLAKALLSHEAALERAVAPRWPQLSTGALIEAVRADA